MKSTTFFRSVGGEEGLAVGFAVGLLVVGSVVVGSVVVGARLGAGVGSVVAGDVFAAGQPPLQSSCQPLPPAAVHDDPEYPSLHSHSPDGLLQNPCGCHEEPPAQSVPWQGSQAASWLSSRGFTYVLYALFQFPAVA